MPTQLPPALAQLFARFDEKFVDKHDGTLWTFNDAASPGTVRYFIKQEIQKVYAAGRAKGAAEEQNRIIDILVDQYEQEGGFEGWDFSDVAMKLDKEEERLRNMFIKKKEKPFVVKVLNKFLSTERKK